MGVWGKILCLVVKVEWSYNIVLFLNEKMERFNRILLVMLRIFFDSKKYEWKDLLNKVLYVYIVLGMMFI